MIVADDRDLEVRLEARLCDREVQCPVADPRDEDAADLAEERERQPVHGALVLHHPLEHGVRERRQRAHADHAALAEAVAAHEELDVAHPADELARMRQKSLARGRELHALSRAIDELQRELRLERLQVVRHGSLGLVEPPRRGGQRSLLRDRDERVQVPNLHAA
jgi:hypothetical protein